MKTTLIPVALVSLALVACSGDDGMTDTDSSSNTNPSSGIMSLSDTDSESSTSTTGSQTSDDTTTEGVTTTTAGGTPCQDESDCAQEELCNEDGFCSFDPNWCGGVDVQEQVQVPPNVMLVLDKSGSMVNVDNFWDFKDRLKTAQIRLNS